jgi:hypothetical protein
MTSEWILFEAGALSKTLADTHVCTLLIGMKPTDVKGPLSQFQATTTSLEDMLQLVKTLNSKLGDSAVQDMHLEKAFRLMWPELKAQVDKLPTEEGTPSLKRSQEDMLEELLALVRTLRRSAVDEGHVAYIVSGRFGEGLSDTKREQLTTLLSEHFLSQGILWETAFQASDREYTNITLRLSANNPAIELQRPFRVLNELSAQQIFDHIISSLPRELTHHKPEKN